MKKIENLKPYCSVILCTTICKQENLDDLVKSILVELLDLLDLSGNAKRKIVTFDEGEQKGENFIIKYANSLETGCLHYTETRMPAWTIEEGIEDLYNHLILVCRKDKQLAILITESSKKGLILSKFAQGKEKGLGSLEKIDRRLLDSAFVNGSTKTLWLSGTHRRSSIKADNKILSGINLRDALNPLEDQTYYYTAVKSTAQLGGRGVPVGVSPRNSRVWTTLPNNWQSFCNDINSLLDQINLVEPLTEPAIPVLAIISASKPDLDSLYDIAVIPPELQADLAEDQEKSQAYEKWSTKGRFQIVEGNRDGKTHSTLFLDDDEIGELIFEFDTKDTEEVKINLSGEPKDNTTKEEFEEFIRICTKGRNLKFWFDSGHTISENSVFEIQYRDEKFEHYHWVDFSGYDIHREKPKRVDPATGKKKDDATITGKPLSEVFETNSLFDWTVRSWPNLKRDTDLPGGWLTCDDGAMEIADFIHLTDETGTKILTLIHAKASKTSGISVADYETVCSQAVKNLRFLDNLFLRKGLNANFANNMGKLVWHNRVEIENRKPLQDLLDETKRNFRPQVILLQPSVAKTIREKAYEKTDSKEYTRMMQLDALLLETEASCHGVGADFYVIGEDK